MHVDHGFLCHDGTDIEAVAQDDDQRGDQGHTEGQPGQQAAAAVGKFVDVMHTGVQDGHGG